MEENKIEICMSEENEKMYTPSELFPNLIKSGEPIEKQAVVPSSYGEETNAENMSLMHSQCEPPKQQYLNSTVAWETSVQEYRLSNPLELREECRHRRGMEREEHRSFLRKDEVLFKQRSREKKYLFFYKNNTLVLRIINGNEHILGEYTVLSCRICSVTLYHREGAELCEWMMSLAVDMTGTIMESPLYDAECLYSNRNLSKTLLTRYAAYMTGAVKSEVWNWIRNHLLFLYESAEINEIPSKSGWFKNGNRYCFVTGNDENAIYFNENIKKFTVNKFMDLEEEKIVRAFVEETGKDAEYWNLAILFLYRMSALLLRLTLGSEDNVQSSITLIGESSEIIARTFLRTMQNTVDIINIDTDRIGYIRETVLLIRDTPIIIMSSDPNSRSTQNRLKEVRNWINSGYIEGNRNARSYIFCIRKFSKSYPLDETLVIDTEKIRIPGDRQLFEKMQSLVVKKIENSGNHWVNELHKEYERQCLTERGSKKILPMLLAISAVIKRMFQLTELDNVLTYTETKIRRQFSTQSGIMEIFKENVLQLVEKGDICILDRNSVENTEENRTVFYDNNYYYFTNTVLEKTFALSNIDMKSGLYLKQLLSERELLKRYKSEIGRDLEIDFMVQFDYEKKVLSGIAIKREFFDEVGGISLYERGGMVS